MVHEVFSQRLEYVSDVSVDDLEIEWSNMLFTDWNFTSQDSVWVFITLTFGKTSVVLELCIESRIEKSSEKKFFACSWE